jgi:hypothetical protein
MSRSPENAGNRLAGLLVARVIVSESASKTHVVELRPIVPNDSRTRRLLAWLARKVPVAMSVCERSHSTPLVDIRMVEKFGEGVGSGALASACGD